MNVIWIFSRAEETKSCHRLMFLALAVCTLNCQNICFACMLSAKQLRSLAMFASGSNWKQKIFSCPRNRSSVSDKRLVMWARCICEMWKKISQFWIILCNKLVISYESESKLTGNFFLYFFLCLPLEVVGFLVDNKSMFLTRYMTIAVRWGCVHRRVYVSIVFVH